MKIAKKDIALIMIVLGAMILFCSWKFAYSPSMENIDKEKSKQASLQSEIDDVKKVAGRESDMNREMDGWAKDIENMMSKYHASYSYEDGILWMKQIEDAGTSSGTPVISSYTVSELGIGNFSSEVAGQGKFEGNTYYFGTASYSFSYSVPSYNDLKSFIDYIVTEATRDGVKSLDSMSFAVDRETGAISGNVNMTVYSFTDAAGIVNYKLPVIENVPQHIDIIFGEPTGTEE